MIDTDKPDVIFFRAGDQPDLEEIPQEQVRLALEERRRRSMRNLQWLDTHCDWRPFGEVW